MRRQVQAHFQAEHDTLARLVHEADQSGLSASEAVQHALSAVRDGTDGWETLLAAALTAVARTSGRRVTKQLKATLPDAPDYDPDDPDGEVASLISDYAPILAQSITDTTHGRLNTLLSDLLAGGNSASIADLLDSLKQQYDTWGANDGRASVIADSTTVTGWGAGAYDAAQQTTQGTDVGVVRTWNSVLDKNTRDAHAEADGQTVGLDENFSVGGEELMYPGDPSGSSDNTIGCRCDVSYDIATNDSTEAKSRTAERKQRRDAYRHFMEDVL